MARLDHRTSGRFDQQVDESHAKYVVATVPLAIVLIMFIYEAYQRPSKPFYNLPSYVTDDATLQAAASASGSLVPLMDMVYVVLSFSLVWAVIACYYLGFLRAQSNLLEHYLATAKASLGNVVYESKGWACEFRYYGYCSYQHPDDANVGRGARLIRKRVRIFEPYTRELVPILCLPDYPMSGQGKDDVEYASLMHLKSRPRANFFGRFSLAWFIVCVLSAIYILHQMKIVQEAEYYAGINDDWDNASKGWKVFALFMVCGVLIGAMGGSALAWFSRRWWLIHQGSFSVGDLSIHGFDGVVVESGSGDDYQQMANYK